MDGGPAMHEQLRAVLGSERAAAAAQVDDLGTEMQAIVSLSVEAVPDDEHDAEGSTIGFERARVAALLAHAEQRLTELDWALERLAANAYGRCEVCEGMIPVERLLARPTAVTCMACAAGPAGGRLGGRGVGRGSA